MVALIPKIKKYLEKNPQTITLYGLGFFISMLVIAGIIYLTTL
ncbi:MAG: hypothetical protein SFU25_07000 [Candidatus Caenarcaniphilales bacterium]|nr:hypothetical protein [Candidatus Caenarcaniphilales bacterium]